MATYTLEFAAKLDDYKKQLVQAGMDSEKAIKMATQQLQKQERIANKAARAEEARAKAIETAQKNVGDAFKNLGEEAQDALGETGKKALGVVGNIGTIAASFGPVGIAAGVAALAITGIAAAAAGAVAGVVMLTRAAYENIDALEKIKSTELITEEQIGAITEANAALDAIGLVASTFTTTLAAELAPAVKTVAVFLVDAGLTIKDFADKWLTTHSVLEEFGLFLVDRLIRQMIQPIDMIVEMARAANMLAEAVGMKNEALASMIDKYDESIRSMSMYITGLDGIKDAEVEENAEKTRGELLIEEMTRGLNAERLERNGTTEAINKQREAYKALGDIIKRLEDPYKPEDLRLQEEYLANLVLIREEFDKSAKDQAAQAAFRRAVAAAERDYSEKQLALEQRRAAETKAFLDQISAASTANSTVQVSAIDQVNRAYAAQVQALDELEAKMMENGRVMTQAEQDRLAAARDQIWINEQLSEGLIAEDAIEKLNEFTQKQIQRSASAREQILLDYAEQEAALKAIYEAGTQSAWEYDAFQTALAANQTTRLEAEKALSRENAANAIALAQDTAKELTDIGLQFMGEERARKVESLQSEIAADQERLKNRKNLSTAEKTALQESLKAKREQLSKMAAAEKRQAVFEIILQQGIALAKAAASAPPPSNIPFIAAQLAIFAAQTAAALATPAPKYHAGTVSSGAMAPDEKMVVARKGEMILNERSVQKLNKTGMAESEGRVQQIFWNGRLMSQVMGMAFAQPGPARTFVEDRMAVTARGYR